MPVDRALPAAHDPRSRFSLVIAIVGLAGVAAVFLPFTFNTSPLDAVGTLPFLRGDEHFLEGPLAAGGAPLPGHPGDGWDLPLGRLGTAHAC